MNGIGFWMKNARQVSLPQSMLPMLLAVGMSLRHDGFSLWLALVAAFGVGCAHLGMNLADDYFDYREGSAEKRTRLASDGIRARVAKYPYLSSGAASVRELVVAVCVFLGLAAGAGAVVVACRGVVPLALAGIGAVLGISYSGGPLRLGYRGLGEPVVGLLFGPLLMAGVQYAACGVLDGPVLLVGVAVGLLVTNILYTHSVLDRHADSRMGKRTLAHLLGTPRAMIAASGLFCFAPFVLVAAMTGQSTGLTLPSGWVLVAAGAGCGMLPAAALATFVLLPMAAFLWRSLRSYVLDRPVALRTAPWMGPMGDFKRYCDMGIGWFMLRWLLARNLVSFFALILLVVYTVLEIME